MGVMKTVGIITEYNPYHNGHALQYDRVRQRFGSDTAIVCVMSGSFTQRGEPAIVDKWSRTRMALSMGASLVIELPFPFATASAERFASGGINCLAATGVVGQVVFGSESGSLTDLTCLASLLVEEPPLFKSVLRDELDRGMSFPVARQRAAAASLAQSGEDPGIATLLETANNILAIEYLKALDRMGGTLKPWTHRREGQAYIDAEEATAGNCAHLASATSIRARIRMANGRPSQMLQSLALAMPPETLGILLESVRSGQRPLFPEASAPIILALLGSETPDRIDRIAGMEEGLGRRLMQMAARPAKVSVNLLEDLVEAADTRRFTRTRITRAMTALMAGLTRDDLALFDEAGGPQYLRVLGFDRKGRHLLKLMRQHASLPVLTRGSDLLELTGPAAVRMAGLDRLSTDLWSAMAGLPAGADFDTPVIMR